VPSFSARDRQQLRNNTSGKTYDLAVIGGGITGAGVARDAASRGLSVVLLERGDIATGTSSRSSRLVHGGLRYLEHFKFGLVHESVTERWKLMKQAPHLVWPMPFLYPVYKGERPGLMTLSAGTLLYSMLCAFRTPGPRKVHSARQVLELEAELRGNNLRGAVEYYDCATNDARLTLETALDAAALGAELFPYAEAVSFVDDGEVTTIEVRDLLLDASWPVSARTVVIAAGPWTDLVLERAVPGTPRWLRPTKGVHLVFAAERLPVTRAVVMKTRGDQRMAFAIPWGKVTYVGTTDTEFSDPDAPLTVTREDARYLLDATNDYFPNVSLSLDDIVNAWAGIRPLIGPEDESDVEPVDLSDISREEKLEVYRDRFVVVAGGKLTTYQVMARHVVDRVAKLLASRASISVSGSSASSRPLPGGIGIGSVPALAAQLRASNPGLPGEWLDHLASRYGTRAHQVVELATADSSLLVPLPNCGPVRLAEVNFAVLHEHMCRPDDFLLRRTTIHLTSPDQGAAAVELVCDALTRLGIVAPDDARRMRDEYRSRLALDRQAILT